MYERKGGLFQRPFGRIWVDSERYFINLIHYIHFNPQKHGFTEDFRFWNHSSYHRITSEKERTQSEFQVLDWFDGEINFTKFHDNQVDENNIKHLIETDHF
jgi:hypothetical protein